MKLIELHGDQPHAALIRSTWNQCIDDHSAGSWWHRAEWLDYCAAYDGATARSFALTDNDGFALVICPLVFGDSVGPCAVAIGFREATATGVFESLNRHIAHRLDWHHTAILTRAAPVRSLCGDWPDAWQTYVVDLAQSEADLWRRVRGLITR